MKYADAVAFRRALEDRLRSSDGARIARERKRISFDRYLARLSVAAPEEWLLKGGFALDVRLSGRARTTRDIDLAWRNDLHEVLDALLDAGQVDLRDFFVFAIERTALDSGRMGGAIRFRVEASVAGRTFDTFLLDVGRADETQLHSETLTLPPLLAFAGVEPASVLAVPLAAQIAEKLHAYARIYEGGRPSSRVKDLVDLVLVANEFSIRANDVRTAIDAVFATRASGPIPAQVPDPPDAWRVPYRSLASALGESPDLSHGHSVVARMLNPILSGATVSGMWSPESREWISIGDETGSG